MAGVAFGDQLLTWALLLLHCCQACCSAAHAMQATGRLLRRQQQPGAVLHCLLEAFGGVRDKGVVCVGLCILRNCQCRETGIRHCKKTDASFILMWTGGTKHLLTHNVEALVRNSHEILPMRSAVFTQPEHVHSAIKVCSIKVGH